MASNSNRIPHTARNLLKWFDVRGRATGMWAFALNRITAIGLTVFLYLHLVMLSKLASGEQVYNDFVTVSKTPLFVFGELLVVIAGLYHGLNGLRVAMTSLGIAVPYQKYLFVILTILALAAGAVFAIRMFSV